MKLIKLITVILLIISINGCASFSHTNKRLKQPTTSTKATLHISEDRGKKQKALFILSLSGMTCCACICNVTINNSNPNMLLNKVESRLQNRHFIKQGVDIFGGVFLSSLNSLKNINQYKKECKQFCRLVINFLLDGKPLKSRELFAQLK
jgi:recombinational DNA repair protein (RecF pathway)